MSVEDDIEKTKEKLRETPVNKSTETERGRLKAKIARLKRESEQKKKESQASGQGYAIKQRGDATVSLVGPPSVGKSTLLNKLTNAESEVASYEFTTLEVVPGMMSYNGANIQILDVPGLVEGAAEGKGGGKQVLSVVRNSDMIILMVDEKRLDMVEGIKEELYGAGVRLNSRPPNMDIMERGEGGIEISAPGELSLSKETIEQVLTENGFVNCKVIIREDIEVEDLLDGIMDNRVYIPGVVCVNKTDEIDRETKNGVGEEFSEWLFISAEKEEKLEELKERIWDELGLMRIYMKKRGKDPDMDEPLITEEGCTVEDVIDSLDKDFPGSLDYAKVWGESARFPGQRVGGDHLLKDCDIVELRF